MKKLLFLIIIPLLLPGCAILTELTSFSKCEFSLHSMTDPVIGGVKAEGKASISDFTFFEVQNVAAQILKGTLPFSIDVNVEAMNPGPSTAAVNSLEWIAIIDEVQVAAGKVDERVEVAPSGGRAVIPVPVNIDLFDLLKGDTPKTMINFIMSLYGMGDNTSELTMKIKPGVLIGGKNVVYPDYFTITKEFTAGIN